MKKFGFVKLIITVAAVVSAALCPLVSGCFLFGRLAAPVLVQTGSIYSWEAVEGATKYIISTGGKDISTEETAIRIINPDDGGKLTVTAVSEVNGEIKKKSKAATVELEAITEDGDNYKEYDFTEGKDVLIPSTVDKAVITGDGETKYCKIVVGIRSTPLIVELYDVNCYGGFCLEEGSEPGRHNCVTVRSLGNVRNYIDGVMGAKGSKGDDGSGFEAGKKGGQGGIGCDAGTFGYVVFEGNRDLIFYGGTGGYGGDGGKTGDLNSVGGDGGTGGTGGYGLTATCAYVCLDKGELTCLGGPGGEGGIGGAGKYIFGIPGHGDYGKKGATGEPFRGEKIETKYLAVEIRPASEFNASGENSGSANVSGTYKFFSASNGEETYTVGDTYLEEVPTSDHLTLTFNEDGTLAMTLYGEAAEGLGSWAVNGNSLVLTNPDGEAINGTVNGHEITVTIGTTTYILRK